MAITKTKFVEYTRCDRYVFLEDIRREFLQNPISYQEYKEQEEAMQLQEIRDAMFEGSIGDYQDKTVQENAQLKAMNPYYKRVEIEAGRLASKIFPGDIIYAEKTNDQKCFSFRYKEIPFLCYVDIYNEKGENINIIEVKATTSKKYTELTGGYYKSQKYSIFSCENNIHRLKGEIAGYPLTEEMDLKTYETLKKKLLDRYGIGSYIYDLAVQRFILEGQYKEQKKDEELQHIHYYLGVLNADYVYDGLMENGREVYQTDARGNELITFFDMTEITREYQFQVKLDAERLIKNIEEPNIREVPLGVSCCFKKQTQCKYFTPVCGHKIPEKNSSLSYVNNPSGFLMENGKRIKGLELINAGYLHMLDVPEAWITKDNHFIQRECVKTHTPFMQKEKIRKAIETLEYPIYHLDFETFPSPVPRFRGERPYTQSPFEFSLHIERAPGVCDKEKDNIIFLAKTTNDERKELVECLLQNVDVNKGTLLAQNVSFEKGRIKELASIYPEYHDDLMKLYHRGFDLLWIVNNHKELYEKLGFSKKEIDTFNFYDERLSGSFSIKKTLPIFSELTYANLDVKNGTEAIIEYANYNSMTKEELLKTQEALRIYCQQDTWAMVEILNALRKLVS